MLISTVLIPTYVPLLESAWSLNNQISSPGVIYMHRGTLLESRQ